MSKVSLISAHEVVPRFKAFADNWGVPHTPDALKMWLACAVDTALWRADREEFPDDQWEQLVAEAVAQLGGGR